MALLEGIMAHCLQSAQEFILGAFPAMVGALASEDAEFVCRKNDLSFVELVRPFCQLDAEGTYQFVSLLLITIIIMLYNWVRLK